MNTLSAGRRPAPGGEQAPATGSNSGRPETDGLLAVLHAWLCAWGFHQWRYAHAMRRGCRRCTLQQSLSTDSAGTRWIEITNPTSRL